MNKNLQYILMSITGILLMMISAGTFDSTSDPFTEFYDIGNPSDHMVDSSATTYEPLVGPEVSSADEQQHVEWIDQLAAIDARYPNDIQRLGTYQQLIDEEQNPYAPILLASTIVNIRNQSRNIPIFEEWLNSFGFDNNTISSLEYLANNENSRAMFLLGIYYYQVQHYEQSRFWLDLAARNGDTGAMNQLAWIYRKGLGVSQDIDYAVSLHLHAAEAGSPRAMTNLAYFYTIGQGVEKDIDTASYWYKKAADLDSALALYVVANYTLNGTHNVKKNEAAGVKLLIKSAQFGYKRAMYDVAVRYELGQYLTQNDEHALHWYRQAANLGESDAIAAINRLDR